MCSILESVLQRDGLRLLCKYLLDERMNLLLFMLFLGQIP